MSTQEDLLKSLARLAAQRRDQDMLMHFRRRLKSLEKEAPELAHEFSRTIATAGGVRSMRRFQGLQQSPIDADSGLQLLDVEPRPHADIAPILGSPAREQIHQFLRERRHVFELRQRGIEPNQPGSNGSTWHRQDNPRPMDRTTARFAINGSQPRLGSSELSWPDWSNIKKALDAARLDPAVILLDEFDALGRIRTDDNDVGEMKESSPYSSRRLRVGRITAS